MPRGGPRKAVEHTCVQCGTKFMPIGTRPRKFCGWECRDAAKRSQRINEADGTARCSRCKQWKPIVDFVKGRGGLPHSHCKPCNREWFEGLRRKRGQKPKTTPEQARINAANYKREYNRFASAGRKGAGKMPGKRAIGKMLCLQDAKCTYCGELLDGAYHIEHKLPVSRGGMNNLENLHLTCARCNLRKGTMTHEEFLVSKRRRPYKQAGPRGNLP